MKDIKDYLPFYLGCDVEYKGKIYSWFPENKPHIELCSKIGKRVSYCLWNEVNPILRPLSDMTESEKYNMLDPMMFGLEKLLGTNKIEQAAELVNQLRKKGFDCDGLIEEGLAIDKTK